MSANALTFRNNGPEGMDPDGVIEVGAFVSVMVNANVILRWRVCVCVSLFKTNWDTVVDSFDDMDLKENLLRGVYAYGFEKPSAIQQRAILPCIKGKRRINLNEFCCAMFEYLRLCIQFCKLNVLLGHDVIAQAQSGTGKTATFVISILQRIDMNLKETQALILAPTRELAQQVHFCDKPKVNSDKKEEACTVEQYKRPPFCVKCLSDAYMLIPSDGTSNGYCHCLLYELQESFLSFFFFFFFTFIVLF